MTADDNTIGLPLFSVELSAAVTRDAIARGERGLKGARGQAALAAARVLRDAGDVEEFTTDDVWERLGWIPKGHDEASFMGAVIRHLSQGGEIEDTGRTRVSRRPEQHRKPLRVWRWV